MFNARIKDDTRVDFQAPITHISATNYIKQNCNGWYRVAFADRLVCLNSIEDSLIKTLSWRHLSKLLIIQL